MLELTPIKVAFPRTRAKKRVKFTCSYHSSQKLKLVFVTEKELRRYPSSSARQIAPANLWHQNRISYRYKDYQEKYIDLDRTIKFVKCQVKDDRDMVVAEVVSEIIPTQYLDWVHEYSKLTH